MLERTQRRVKSPLICINCSQCCE